MSEDIKDNLSKQSADASKDLFERDNLSEKSLKSEDQLDPGSVSHGEELFLQSVQQGG